MKAINDLKKKITEARNTLEREAKGALKEAFIEFFDENPTVESIRWQQYTPHFNDGDACTFGVYDFTFSTKESIKEGSGDDEDGYEYTWHPETPEARAVSKFRKAVDLDEAFEAAFGDHAQVTATRKGFDVEEFEHN